MRGLNVLLVEGGQGRGGADCRWHAGVFLWVALCLAALVIIEASFPSGEPPSARSGGGSFSQFTASAPIDPDFARGGRAPLE